MVDFPFSIGSRTGELAPFFVNASQNGWFPFVDNRLNFKRCFVAAVVVGVLVYLDSTDLRFLYS